MIAGLGGLFAAIVETDLDCAVMGWREVKGATGMELLGFLIVTENLDGVDGT